MRYRELLEGIAQVKLAEVDVIDRDRLSTAPPPPPRRMERGGKGEPKRMTFFAKNAMVVPVPSKANEIVNPAGQYVILYPEKFGIDQDEIVQALSKYDRTKNEISRFVNKPREDFDSSKHADLWQSSKDIFNYMLQQGWVWGDYNPPEFIHIKAIPSVVKRQMEALADRLALSQIDKISITLVTDFTAHSPNKTVTFQGNGGFGGNLFHMFDWLNGKKEAPQTNWVYLLSNMPPDHILRSGIPSIRGRVRTGRGETAISRSGYVIKMDRAPIQPTGEQTLYRVPYSVLAAPLHGGRPIETSRNSISFVSDRYIHVRSEFIEYLKDGKWVSVNAPK